jgi:hypothetical protein
MKALSLSFAAAFPFQKNLRCWTSRGGCSVAGLPREQVLHDSHEAVVKPCGPHIRTCTRIVLFVNRLSFGKSFARALATAAIAGAFALSPATAGANPANCDPDMTEDQRFQKELCAAHLGCRLVMAIQDTCVGVKSFVAGLGLGPRGSGGPVTDARIEQALAALGVPPPGLPDCTVRFDRSKCRQYLGLESAPTTPSASRESLTPQNELRQLSSKLLEEETMAKAGSGPYHTAKSNLEGCVWAKDQSDRDQVCARAQQAVDQCNGFRDGWYARKAKMLADARTMGIEKEFFAMPRVELPPCPYTLPNSWLTPAQALAEWNKGGDSNDIHIARCDGMRRSLSEALDSDNREKATAVVTAFEVDCGKFRQVYAEVAAGARARIASMNNSASENSTKPAGEEAPLPRRAPSSLTGMLQGAINQAEVTVRQRELEERQRQEAAERQRAAEAQQAANAAAAGTSAVAASNPSAAGGLSSGAVPSGSSCKKLDDAAVRVAQEDMDQVQYKRVQTAVPVVSLNVALSKWRLNVLLAHGPCKSEPRVIANAQDTLQSAQRLCQGSRITADCSSGNFAIRNADQLSAAMGKIMASASTPGGSASNACEPEVTRLQAEFAERVARNTEGSVGLHATTASMSKKLSDALRPCDPRMAQELANRAASSLRSCEQLATNAAYCSR